MNMTLATSGAAWVCLLAALLVYDQVQNALNGQANLLFAGGRLLDLTIMAALGLHWSFWA
jgi:hypothetical protein